MAEPGPGGLRPMRPIQRRPHVEEILPLRQEGGQASAAKPKVTCQSLAHYQEEALKKIGGENQDIRQRNEKISGAYAALWMQDHDAYRWQGLAAHASTGVGMVMDVTNPQLQNRAAGAAASAVVPDHVPSWVPGPLAGPVGRAGQAASDAAQWVGDSAVGRRASEAAHWVDDHTRQPLDANMQKMMGDGNLAIYKEIYPASLAYAHGGMAELNCVSDHLSGEEKRRFDKTRAAFADTDRGIALKQAGDAVGGEQMIRAGAAKLVHIEQDDVAQTAIYDKNPNLARIMGPFAYLQLSGDHLHPDLSTLSLYYQNHAGSSLGNMAQRDDWILNDVVPTWYQQYEQRPALTTQRMQTILDRGRAAGGDY